MERAFAQHHGARAPRQPLVIARPSPVTSTPVAYCIVAGGIDAEATDRLRAHLQQDRIELVVDHRSAGRRQRDSGRRHPRRGGGGQNEPERRRILHAHGRRVAERRAIDEPGPVALLPPDIAASIGRSRLRFVTHAQPDSGCAKDIEAAHLVIRFQAGDRETALAELYSHYTNAVYRFALAAVGDPQESEAVCAQVLLNVARGLSAFNLGSETFRSWLFRIVRNCVVERLRCGKRSALIEPALFASLADVASREGLTGGSDWISRSGTSELVDRLPGSEREVILLRYALGCTHAESAALLGRTEASVRQSDHLGLRAIQAGLDQRRVTLKSWRRSDQPMRALFVPRQLAVSGFSRLRHF
jgi:RNA polymerase sigma-70 factor (ECF subfamily)